MHIKKVSVLYTNLRKRFQTRKKRKVHHKKKLQERKEQEEDDDEPSVFNINPSFLSNDDPNADGTKSDNARKGSTDSYRQSEFTHLTDTTLDTADLDWDSLTFSDKANLYNFWTIVVIIGDILLIIGSAFLIFNTNHSFQPNNHILGFSAFCHWCGSLKYMENIRGYNIIGNTFVNSGMIVIKAMAGVLPLFIAFTLLGMCLFIDSMRFGSVSLSMYTLFSLQNGDSVFDIFYEVQQNQFLAASIFMYVFIFISTSIIANVFVVMVGDAYVKSKYYHKNDWIRLTDDHGNVIKRNDDEEDPLEPFYTKTQKEIDSRKALVKILLKDKELLMRDYYKGKYEAKRQRDTLLRSDNGMPDIVIEKENPVKLDKKHLPLSVLNLSIVKYLKLLSYAFERDMEGGKDDTTRGSFAGHLPDVVKALKEDVYDRYTN
jgi:hypothetical protein